MKFTDELQERIISALRQRLGQTITCAVCRHTEWILTKGFAIMPTQEDSETVHVTGRGTALLMAVLTCSHCGQILFFNILSLGLSDFFKEQGITEEHDVKL